MAKLTKNTKINFILAGIIFIIYSLEVLSFFLYENANSLIYGLIFSAYFILIIINIIFFLIFKKKWILYFTLVPLCYISIYLIAGRIFGGFIAPRIDFFYVYAIIIGPVLINAFVIVLTFLISKEHNIKVN